MEHLDRLSIRERLGHEIVIHDIDVYIDNRYY